MHNAVNYATIKITFLSAVQLDAIRTRFHLFVPRFLQ